MGIHYGVEAAAADACLDRGGLYDYETQTCSPAGAAPATSYLGRHWPKLLLANLVSSAGLVLLWSGTRRRG